MPSLQLHTDLPPHDRRLTLDFTQQNDRFVTSLLIDATDPPLAVSLEGPATEDLAAWPQSAPLQEIIPQTIDGLDILAGIGRAGKSHWSVIIKPLQDRPGFDFEFACRVKESPNFLGSTYRTPTADSREPWSLRAESSDALIQSDNDRLVIRPTIAADIAFPATIQWQYQLVLDV